MTRFLPLFVALCMIVVIPSAPGQEVGCGRWEPLLGADGTGPDNVVWSLAVFDAGDGPMLYVGGQHINAAGRRMPYLARWDGADWSPVPGLEGPEMELDQYVRSMFVWDDGTGESLYVGGAFTMAGGQVVNHIARFDGTTWSALGGAGGVGLDAIPITMHAHDFGQGEVLVVAGRFTTAGGVAVNRVASWDGAAWAALGDDSEIDTTVIDLESFGGSLYASLSYQSTTSASFESGVVRFDGDAWQRVVGPDQTFWTLEVWPLAVFDDGDGERLYAGGRFSVREGDDRIAEGFAWWDGQRWEGTGRQQIASQIGDLLPFNDGTGKALYVSGTIRDVLEGGYVGVARWRGGAIESFGQVPDTFGRVLATYDDGTGEALYLGGSFRNPWRGTGPMRFIVVWRPGPGCPADFNGDCQLDLLDWIHFGRLWRQQDPKADFDGDGEFTVFDYLAFQNAFDAGCP